MIKFLYKIFKRNKKNEYNEDDECMSCCAHSSHSKWMGVNLRGFKYTMIVFNNGHVEYIKYANTKTALHDSWENEYPIKTEKIERIVSELGKLT